MSRRSPKKSQVVAQSESVDGTSNKCVALPVCEQSICSGPAFDSLQLGAKTELEKLFLRRAISLFSIQSHVQDVIKMLPVGEKGKKYTELLSMTFDTWKELTTEASKSSDVPAFYYATLVMCECVVDIADAWYKKSKNILAESLLKKLASLLQEKMDTL